MHLGRMIALQEELDWFCYAAYGVCEEPLVAPLDEVPHTQLGERAFEILWATQLKMTL